MPTRKKAEEVLVDLFYIDDSTIGEYATEEEEFEDLYTIGMQPADFADSEIGARYTCWLEKNKDYLQETYGDLND